jgi:large subunit ribosomal protein L4
MINLPVLNSAGKEIDSIKLDKEVISDKINTSLIYQVVLNLRAGQRKGLAATKTRGEVSGGGKKPWKQKGTGRARVGSSRNPLWRHGGVVFGPHPRDFSYPIPGKMKKGALKEAFSFKVAEMGVIVADGLNPAGGKTKELAGMLANLGLKVSRKPAANECLLLVLSKDGNLGRAARNLDYLTINLASDTNAYEVLAHRKIIITKEALTALVKRFE